MVVLHATATPPRPYPPSSQYLAHHGASLKHTYPTDNSLLQSTLAIWYAQCPRQLPDLPHSHLHHLLHSHSSTAPLPLQPNSPKQPSCVPSPSTHVTEACSMPLTQPPSLASHAQRHSPPTHPSVGLTRCMSHPPHGATPTHTAATW